MTVTKYEDGVIKRILKKMKQMGYPDDSIEYAKQELYKNPEGQFAKNLVASMISLGIANLIFEEVSKGTTDIYEEVVSDKNID